MRPSLWHFRWATCSLVDVTSITVDNTRMNYTCIRRIFYALLLILHVVEGNHSNHQHTVTSRLTVPSIVHATIHGLTLPTLMVASSLPLRDASSLNNPSAPHSPPHPRLHLIQRMGAVQPVLTPPTASLATTPPCLVTTPRYSVRRRGTTTPNS